MNEKRSPSDVGASERAVTENEIGQISFPGFDFTLQQPTGQAKITPLLGVGRSAALTIKDLCSLTGWDNRTVRLTIQRERLAGQAICSDNTNGYYRPADDKERLDCVRSLRHRAGEINRVASALEKARL